MPTPARAGRCRSTASRRSSARAAASRSAHSLALVGARTSAPGTAVAMSVVVVNTDCRPAGSSTGTTAALSVRRQGEVLNLSIVARPGSAPASGVEAPPVDLGLVLTTVRAVGSRVVRVDPRSAAERAGVQAGDVITRAGDRPAPTPAQVRRLFDAAEEDGALVLAITRGTTHLVVALSR